MVYRPTSLSDKTIIISNSIATASSTDSCSSSSVLRLFVRIIHRRRPRAIVVIIVIIIIRIVIIPVFVYPVFLLPSAPSQQY